MRDLLSYPFKLHHFISFPNFIVFLKFNDDVTAKTVAMFQKIEELNQRMAMCEKRMGHVVDKFKDFSEEKRNECKQLEGKASMMKKSVLILQK
uniref:Uncharacterized protein n=1 Tax=Strongyloides papillosus TaxID=174720 RepID=A0A0N5BIU2_STREA